ncbi:MAG: recombination mediator RecR [Erysipelotrichaceae bacterium]|nr:recombination mediator RecR [Erysipelotrichaceae bacterium]
MYPETLTKLIDCFMMLPGVGSKTAERYALLMIEKDEEEITRFIEALKDIKTKIHECKICGNLCEDEECLVCRDKTRNKKQILVVQSSKDVIALEKTLEYHGVYHVLKGLISQTKGILPEDLNIKSLLDRVDDAEEVIIATNPTLEGETTALYLDKLLSSKNILTTRIAHGIPMGGHLDYADELTLIKALEGRKKM